LELFDFTFQRSGKKMVIEQLSQVAFLHAREDIMLGPCAAAAPDVVGVVQFSSPSRSKRPLRNRLSRNGAAERTIEAEFPHSHARQGVPE